MERSQRAENLFRRGYNCAQSVLLAFADVAGVPADILESVSSTFGGGMGRLGEVCGAVSAMFMLLGLVRKVDTTDRAAKAALYAEERELAGKFRERAGSIICRELLTSGVKEDIGDKPRCLYLVGLAASLIEELLKPESGVFKAEKED